MQKLTEAKNLSIKADSFVNQGNYQFAIGCYDRINDILKQSISLATTQETIQQIKQKIEKYVHLKGQAERKIKEKKEVAFKKSPLFGFPIISNHFNNLIDEPTRKSNENDIRNYGGSFKEQKRVINQQQQGKRPFDKFEKTKFIKKQTNKKPNIHNVKKCQQNNHGVPKLNKSLKKKIVIDHEVEELIIKNLDVSFQDIAGLQQAKSILQEAVIRPRKRPDLYVGIRAPPKGLLLYGPPGNGKTYICKALAKESNCTFFALSASSVLNKYVGQSQKTIRKIFDAALKMAPSIIFIDEIDSMLTARSQAQNQASRRLKTEFLVLMDGINSPKGGEVLVIGATNLPKQLDTAAKRRFSKFIYIGNPDYEARKQLLLKNLSTIEYELSNSDIDMILKLLEYYSASQIRNIISEACMIPLRQVSQSQFFNISKSEIRKLNKEDFLSVVNQRKPIVSKQQLQKYKEKI